MAMIWEQTRQLEGETLYTVYRHKPFNIINVHEDRVTFVPQDGKGTHRWVRREQIERISERVHEDESADDMNDYIAQQRREDQTRDL